MSNVPRPDFSDTGLSTPSESSIVAGLLADFQAAFGGALNPSPATPQGQLIASLAAILGANNDLFLDFVSQVDPDFASGRMQDAIGRIYYLTRIPGTATTVACTCTGLSGTVIPGGSLAQAVDGTIYQSLGNATIPSGGSVVVQFQAIVPGAIACLAGSLNQIYKIVPGWDSITNPGDGVLGRDVESRADFELRRSQSVAGNAAGILPAILGAVLAVPGVSDAYVTENPTGSSVTIGGVSVAARSLYVAALGGTDADVAAAIWSRKPPGCGYTGDTTVTVTDRTGYSMPFPSYPVTFKRPSAVPLYFAVQITNSTFVPADAQTQIRNAMVDAFAGKDGGARARIGSTVYALRFVSAIQKLGSWAQLVSIAIGTTSSPAAADVVMQIDQVPTLPAANISVTLV